MAEITAAEAFDLIRGDENHIIKIIHSEIQHKI